ncbi:sulfotransferase 1C4-like isoform X2 [Penaeus chinensis]|uniref:sulfotransferase 1C4-like isoform X2 n=1 Tax=Penaeus chinensis TaxID=139456 RepID=UPI001FB60885|nr:sulfotransferase 1C4-like isoform X2 [Penaeus chinensis]
MLNHGCQKSRPEDGTRETRFPFQEFPFLDVRAVAAMEGRTYLAISCRRPSLRWLVDKMVYVTRNPCGKAVSYLHFTQLDIVFFKSSLADYVKQFLEDKEKVGGWHETDGDFPVRRRSER